MLGGLGSFGGAINMPNMNAMTAYDQAMQAAPTQQPMQQAAPQQAPVSGMNAQQAPTQNGMPQYNQPQQAMGLGGFNWMPQQYGYDQQSYNPYMKNQYMQQPMQQYQQPMQQSFMRAPYPVGIGSWRGF